MPSPTLKPWREVAVPHDDVLRGTFQQAEYAADLSLVHRGGASAEYQDPVLFFQRTFITEGMRLLLDSVVRRIAGVGGDPVIQLQTAFGGGKTHTMLAVYHLARGERPVSDLAGVAPILDAARIVTLPKARVVVLDGTDIPANMPVVHGGIKLNTLWGHLAWQLGGETAYARIADADTSGTSPGKEALSALLSTYAPCVILIDELVAYIRQLDDQERYAGGSYSANITFMQALTEAVKAVPNAILLASLPESEREAGSARGYAALQTLEHQFGRVQAIWKPVAAEEAFEIVRRRLFAGISDAAARDAVCRAFADTYVAHPDDFPIETQEGRYRNRLIAAYPIHPEVFDRLYEDWSTLENFQRTRGVLKLMAKVIYRLWTDGNNDLMILPGSLPLYDADTRNELLYYLPAGWDPVVDADIDGEKAESVEIDRKDTRLGSLHAARKAARTIFFGTAPGSPEAVVRGMDPARVLLGCVQPGQPPAVYHDGLNRLADRLRHLYAASGRYWFDLRPTLRREMEERRRRFDDREHVLPAIRDEIGRVLRSDLFAGIHRFAPSGDVPDDLLLRLVVLPPTAGYSRATLETATTAAAQILKHHGEQPRQRQNRLVFLAPDADTVPLLLDHVRVQLAWQSILDDYGANRIVLDNLMANSVRQQLDTAKRTMQRTVREAYRWLLVPCQTLVGTRPEPTIIWEAYAVNTASQDFGREVDRVLIDNETVIREWAAVHLFTQLRVFFWREDRKSVSARQLWQDFGTYLYFPRLKDEQVLCDAIRKGAAKTDYFGIAADVVEGKYIDFTYGEPFGSCQLDAVYLIEPGDAAQYKMAVTPPIETGTGTGTGTGPSSGIGSGIGTGTGPKPPVKGSRPRRFYGVVDLDPQSASLAADKAIVEVVLPLVNAGLRVRISLDIDAYAENDTVIADDLERIVKENSNQLRFRTAEFE